MNKLELQLNTVIDVRQEEIEKRLSHEVIEELMDSFGYIRSVLFERLLRQKWLEYISRN